MSYEVPSVSRIVSLLPRKLQTRFDSLSGFVRAVIDEEIRDQGNEVRLTAEDIQVIQLAALFYLLGDFFQSGTRAAREAATTLQELGVTGFQVGSQQFTRDNENTLRGDMLASRLRGLFLDLPLGRYIRNASSMTDLITRLVRDMNNGESVR